MSNRLNKQDLAAALVQADVGITTKKHAVEVIEALTDIITTQVVAGNSVALPNFGKFSLYTRMNGAKKPKFSPYGEFKDLCANG